MSWKEYSKCDANIADWLNWGGLVLPDVMRNKDDSMFGVIEYAPLDGDPEGILQELPEFKNGWSIWLEDQCTISGEKHYMVVCWNPFYSMLGKMSKSFFMRMLKGIGKWLQSLLVNTADTSSVRKIINHLDGDKELYYWQMKDSLHRELEKIVFVLRKATDCRILEYQEVLDFLTYSIGIAHKPCPMPAVPLYLDAYVSQNFKVDFSSNNIVIDDKKICVITLPPLKNNDVCKNIHTYLHDMNYSYRHVQRLLLFGSKKAKKEEQRYTSLWCPGRNSMKNLITEDVLDNINGYYLNIYIIGFPEDDYDEHFDMLRGLLDYISTPYTVEDYNLKDIWWASLPGMFRPYAEPPACGFRSLNDLMAQNNAEGGHKTDHV